jgi:hypothetical protein
VDHSTALLAGTLIQIDKQLKLIPTSFQTSNSKHEIIYTTYKEMYNRKKTFMIILFNINTQRTKHENHEFESTLSINPIICTWLFLHNSLRAPALLRSLPLLIVTIHNEGVYIPFPSCALKLSNLELNYIYFTLTTINVFYLLRTRANFSRSICIIQVCFFLMASFKMAHQLQGDFKICAGHLSSCLFLPC